MSSYPILPEDVLDLVLRELDADSSPQGRHTLSACSYVNRTIHALAQKRIFNKIRLAYDLFEDPERRATVLVDDYETSTGHKFLRLLEKSPHLSSYVRSLTIQANARRNADGKSKSFHPSSDMAAFSLYHIATRLDQLQSFILQGSMKWYHLERRTQSFLRDLVPRMQHLSLASIEDFPISSFQGSPELQELRVSSCDWDIVDDPVHVTADRVKLRVLDIGNPSTQMDSGVEMFDSPHSPLDLRQLRSLRLSTLRYTVAGIDRMLSICAETLEILEFSVNRPFADPSLSIATDPPNFSSLKSLRRLTINTCVREQPTNYNQPQPLGTTYDSTDFGFIDSMIQTLPAFNSRPGPPLQIDLSITLQQLNPRLRSIPWSKLFHSMNADQFSSSLKVVNLTVWKIYGYIRLASLPEILGSCPELKELQEKGKLNYGSHNTSYQK